MCTLPEMYVSIALYQCDLEVYDKVPMKVFLEGFRKEMSSYCLYLSNQSYV